HRRPRRRGVTGPFDPAPSAARLGSEDLTDGRPDRSSYGPALLDLAGHRRGPAGGRGRLLDRMAVVAGGGGRGGGGGHRPGPAAGSAGRGAAVRRADGGGHLA